MRLIRTIDEAAEVCAGGVAMTIGVFDGVHAGHQALMGRVIGEAMSRRLKSLVFTFEEHPLTVLAPPHAPPTLTRAERKAELIGGLGIDICLMLRFTREFSETPAEAFVEEVLLGACQARFVICGANFTFGKQGRGDAALLREIAARRGAEVEVLRPIMSGVGEISSTRIRDALIKGDVADAEAMLTRPYGFQAEVVTGHQRGRSIGYPTANLKPAPGQLVPADGVYATLVRVEAGGADVFGGMLNVGRRPTFEGAGRAMEVHLFDFTGDLVGRTVEVEFVARVRDERKFGSVDDLVAQLKRDEETCRRLTAPKL